MLISLVLSFSFEKDTDEFMVPHGGYRMGIGSVVVKGISGLKLIVDTLVFEKGLSLQHIDKRVAIFRMGIDESSSFASPTLTKTFSSIRPTGAMIVNVIFGAATI